MEYGQVKKKAVREFLRAADMLIADLQDSAAEKPSDYEVRLLIAYLERLRTVLLGVENAAIRKEIQEDRARRRTD